MKPRVLVVDDDIMLASIAGEILELAGYDVRVHTSPFGTNVAMNEFRPDVVLLDVNMPALSGDRLVPLLASARDRLGARIVFFSSNDEATLRTQVRESGADGFIRKGDIDRLGDRVAAIMRPN